MTDPEARRTIGKIILLLSTLTTGVSVPALLGDASLLSPPFIAGLAGMAYGAMLIRFSASRWP